MSAYVLIHGGGSTGRFWDRVAPLLDHPVLAVDLPGRGDRPADLPTITVDDEVASVLEDIESAGIDDGIVLVAHSSGGLVVPGVAAALGERVSHVVLNAALVPADGGCGLDCMKPAHRDGLVMAVEHATLAGTAITLPGPPEDPESFRRATGGDPLDDDDLAFVVDPVRLVPDTVHHYFQPIHWSAAAAASPAAATATYIVTERDRPIPRELQEAMIGHLPGTPTVIRIDSGHLAAVTHPAEVAGMLRQAAAGGG